MTLKSVAVFQGSRKLFTAYKQIFFTRSVPTNFIVANTQTSLSLYVSTLPCLQPGVGAYKQCLPACALSRALVRGVIFGLEYLILATKKKMLGKQLFFGCMCGRFGALMGPCDGWEW